MWKSKLFEKGGGRGLLFLALISCAQAAMGGGPPSNGPTPGTGYPNQPPNSPFPNNQTGAPFQEPVVPNTDFPKPQNPPPLLATPSAQPSPEHFTSTKMNSPSYGATPTSKNSEGQSKVASDPRWVTAVAEYEKKAKQYQKIIDGLWLKHGKDWKSLQKDPRDLKTCDDIMRQWQRDETTLWTLYKQLMKPGATPLSANSPAKQTLSQPNTELNANDIDQ